MFLIFIIIARFHFADRALKTHLFRSYCLGGALWNLSSGPVRALEVSYNNILRRIWSLPRTAHTAVVHSAAELKSVFNLLYCRFLKLVSIVFNHNSLLVQSMFRFSIQSCSNFIGYNFLYGSCHVKQYSDFEVGCSKIVRELRTPGFDQSELNLFVDHISTY